MNEILEVPAKWINDCQGKKDFDGNLVSVSSRYWPRGGGFHALDTATGDLVGNEARPEIKPSAHTSILLYHGDPESSDYETLAQASFEADTEEAVKALVETWAATQYSRIVVALRKEFAT